MSPSEYRRLKFQPGHKTRRCWLCGCELTFASATVDHLTPKSRGGRDMRQNYRLACSPCNSARGNRRLTKLELAAARGRPKKTTPDRTQLVAAIRRGLMKEYQ